MESGLVVLVIVVALVAIDVIGRLDERRQRRGGQRADVMPTRIAVDLRDRSRHDSSNTDT